MNLDSLRVYGGRSVNAVRVLYLGPFAVTPVVDAKAAEWKSKLSRNLGATVELITADPPFDVEDDPEGKGHWVRPYHPKEESRRKLFRKQLFSSLVLLLTYVVKYQPAIILGIEQGALIAALSSLPLVLEAACRARIVMAPEVAAIRRAWAGVVGVLAVNPRVIPGRSD